MGASATSVGSSVFGFDDDLPIGSSKTFHCYNQCLRLWPGPPATDHYGAFLMCGICGVVSSDGTYPLEESVLIAMRDLMVHRGPDDAGHCRLPGVALGSRRLAILDLSERGHMPMTTR